MKTETTKSIKDEISFVIIATIILIVLSLIIFPLFIALLPIVIVAGCREIWYVDHLKKRR